MSESHDAVRMVVELQIALRHQWREGRRKQLAAAGIEVRRPQHDWPEPPDEPTVIAATWADSIVTVAAIDAGGIENVELAQLLELVDSYLEYVAIDDAPALLAVDDELLADAVVAALVARRDD